MDNRKLTSKIARIMKAVEVLSKAEDDDLKDALPKDFGVLDQVVEGVNDFEKKLAKLLRKQVKHYADAVRLYVAKDEGASLGKLLTFAMTYKKTDLFQHKLLEQADELFTNQVGEMTNIFMDLIDKDVSFNQKFSKQTQDWVSDWAWELSDLLNTVNMSAIERAINNGLENGWGIDKIADELEKLPEFDRKRARRVALTETLTASSVAQMEAYRQSPAVVKKSWKHSGPRNITPRPAHVALSGTEVSIEDTFNVNGHSAMYPRDTSLPASERVSCHCVMGPVVDEEIFGLSKEEKQAIRDSVINGGTAPVIMTNPNAIKSPKDKPKTVQTANIAENRKAFNVIRQTDSVDKYNTAIADAFYNEMAQVFGHNEKSWEYRTAINTIRGAWTTSSTGGKGGGMQKYVAEQGGYTIDLGMNEKRWAELTEEEKAAMEFMKAYTQQQLVDAGYTHVRAYRGVFWLKDKDGEIPEWLGAPNENDTFNFKGRALSSWSMDKSVAFDFARMTNNDPNLGGTVMEVDIPISQVHAFYDAYSECEVVPEGDILGVKMNWKPNVDLSKIKKSIVTHDIIQPIEQEDWLKEWAKEVKVEKMY